LDGPPLTSARGRHAPSVQSGGNPGDTGDALSLDCLNNRSEIGCTFCRTLNPGAPSLRKATKITYKGSLHDLFKTAR
jgi:hypothetical protein